MEAGRKLRRVGYFRWHQIVWKFGGIWERILLVIYAATAYVFFPLVIAWLILALLGDFVFPWEFYVTFGLALFNIPSFFDVFAVGLYNTDAWSELLRRGYFHPHDRLAAEYAAYLKTVGVGGAASRCHPVGAGLLGTFLWLGRHKHHLRHRAIPTPRPSHPGGVSYRRCICGLRLQTSL